MAVSARAARGGWAERTPSLRPPPTRRVWRCVIVRRIACVS